ncbi:MAG: alpha/beta fold hydrolase [Oscillospiraceae bacterium]|nr:alpha/beta fold hydrolase [Oscillospiraceae bacterium]
MKEFFIDSDGTRIHAKLERPEGAEKGPLCILVHGFTGHMEEDHLIAVKQALLGCGISVLRAEMYGHGKSDGIFKDHTLFKWVTNALSVVAYAKNLDFVTDLYMCGHSQGGLLTMLIGGMCADDFKAILPLSPAWMIPEIAREGNLLGVDFDPVHIPKSIFRDALELSGDYIRTAQMIHVEDAIAKYKGKVFIVHGDNDDTVPFFYAEKAVKLYNDATLVPIPGADHCFIGQTDELADAIRGFFAGGCTA